jgi:hypothetical protein
MTDYIVFSERVIVDNVWNGYYPGHHGGLKACIAGYLDFGTLRRDLERGKGMPSGDEIAYEIYDHGWGSPQDEDEGCEIPFETVADLAQEIIDVFVEENTIQELDLGFLIDGGDGYYYYRAAELGREVRVEKCEVDGFTFTDYQDFCDSTCVEVQGEDGEWEEMQ